MGMDLRKLGVLAGCLALPVSALNPGLASGWTPAKETDKAELVEKSSTGVSPVPTSSPELVAMELFKRADYSLPDDYCGWYADYKSASYTCGRIGASCINSGDYRGCCVGTGSSCASTFYTTCVDGTRLASSLSESSSCGLGTICCSGTDYPSCGTILFSSSARPSDTYTIVDCYSAGFGTTYYMQDYPPYTSTTASSESSKPVPTPSHSTTPTPTHTEAAKKSNVGPIVGGTIGGVAVIGLIILGILYLYRWRPKSEAAAQAAASGPVNSPPANPSYPQDPSAQYQQSQMSPQMSQMSPGGQFYPSQTGTPSTYDPRYSYYQGGAYPGSPPMHSSASPTTGGMMSTPSPDPSKMGESTTSPTQGHFASEAPARNPVGMGNNAAELAG